MAALEAEAIASSEASRVAADRLRSETGELRSRIEYVEARCREAEQRHQLAADGLEGELEPSPDVAPRTPPSPRPHPCPAIPEGERSN